MELELNAEILRRMSEEAATVEEAAKRLDAEEGITEKPSSLLVEGEPDALVAIAEKLDGWSLLDSQQDRAPRYPRACEAAAWRRIANARP